MSKQPSPHPYDFLDAEARSALICKQKRLQTAITGTEQDIENLKIALTRTMRRMIRERLIICEDPKMMLDVDNWETRPGGPDGHVFLVVNRSRLIEAVSSTATWVVPPYTLADRPDIEQRIRREYSIEQQVIADQIRNLSGDGEKYTSLRIIKFNK